MEDRGLPEHESFNTKRTVGKPYRKSSKDD